MCKNVVLVRDDLQSDSQGSSGARIVPQSWSPLGQGVWPFVPPTSGINGGQLQGMGEGECSCQGEVTPIWSRAIIQEEGSCELLAANASSSWGTCPPPITSFWASTPRIQYIHYKHKSRVGCGSATREQQTALNL